MRFIKLTTTTGYEVRIAAEYLSLIDAFPNDVEVERCAVYVVGGPPGGMLVRHSAEDVANMVDTALGDARDEFID